MKYTELEIFHGVLDPEILIAHLSELGFESFVEEEGKLKAYISAQEYDQDSVSALLHDLQLKSRTNDIEQQNWNQIWESNFEPIVLQNCIIRASFHERPQHIEYDIVINPKMSFGTGHHETTYMMLKYLLANPPAAKRVVDAGCGTGILSILAEKLGAESVISFDIEDWAVTNSQENMLMNDCSKIDVMTGTIRDISGNLPADLILANIHKNVLLDEMSEYVCRLKKGGVLVLSGFYEDDIADIEEMALSKGLSFDHTESLNKWCCRSYIL